MVTQSKAVRKRTTQARRHDIEVRGHVYQVILTPAAEAGLPHDLIQVSSKSEPDGLRTVQLGDGRTGTARCSCDGWRFRGDCAHLKAASEAVGREVGRSAPATARTKGWEL